MRQEIDVIVASVLWRQLTSTQSWCMKFVSDQHFIHRTTKMFFEMIILEGNVW